MVRKKNLSSRTSKDPVLVENDRKQANKPEMELQVPLSSDDQAAWHAYWQSRFQVLRTNPEISSERQNELKRHLVNITTLKRETTLLRR